MKGALIVAGLGLLFDAVVFVLLLHWHGVVADEQRAEDDRIRRREIDVSTAEQLYAFQITRGNRYTAALLDETKSKDRRRRPRAESHPSRHTYRITEDTAS